MPTYEYECDNCGYTCEEFKPYSSRKNELCPNCGEEKLIRLIGRGGGIIIDISFRDSKGTPISFKEPYYDRALQKEFHSKKEKQKYMKENKLIMDGSTDSPNRHRILEAGDTRKRKTTYI